MFILPFLIGLVLRHQRPEPLRVLDSVSADPDLGATAPTGRERCTSGASGVRAPGVPPRILQTIRRFVSRCGAVGAPHHPLSTPCASTPRDAHRQTIATPSAAPCSQGINHARNHQLRRMDRPHRPWSRAERTRSHGMERQRTDRERGRPPHGYRPRDRRKAPRRRQI